ncbi:MAG: uroporphyrinogen-III C-methyltransferase [Planctomycetota bacterium]
MNGGRVYLVGAGPGDPALLTLRGRELLSRAEVVVYDRLAADELLDYAPEAEHVYAGKRAKHHSMTQEEINRLLVERARNGRCVVRLKGGDPFVFGRGGEEALALAEAGVPFEVVPGVTAGVGAAAYAGIPVTHREVASGVAMMTGHRAADREESRIDWAALARWQGTLAFYMGVGSLRENCRRLTENGYDPDTPAAAVRWGTTPRQRVVSATVSTLPAAVEQADLHPPALIVIGGVVGLREKLAWFENRPLFGRRIVVTRPEEQNESFMTRLRELGAAPIEFPVIRIAPAEDDGPLKEAVDRLTDFDWVALTSVNGVDAFFRALEGSGEDARALAGRRMCAIGPKTAARLAEHGIRADLQPQRYTTAGIVNALEEAEEGLSGVRILCPRSDAAPPEMIRDLAARGARVEEVTAYRTLPAAGGDANLPEMLRRDEVDWLTFTSSSTVTNFFAAVEPERVRSSSARIASIGPVTSETVRGVGLEPDAEAQPHTVEGLTEAVIRAEQHHEVTK